VGEHFNLRVYDKLNSNDIIENFHVLKIKPYEENGFVYEKWVLRNFSDIKPFYKEYKLFFLDDLLPNIRSVMYPITHKTYFIRTKYMLIHKGDEANFYKLFRFFPAIVSKWVSGYEASILSYETLNNGVVFEERVIKSASFDNSEIEIVERRIEWLLENNKQSYWHTSLKLNTTNDKIIYHYEISSEDYWYLNLTDEQFLELEIARKKENLPDDLFVSSFMEAQA